jgi:hypothetical protein
MPIPILTDGKSMQVILEVQIVDKELGIWVSAPALTSICCSQDDREEFLLTPIPACNDPVF